MTAEAAWSGMNRGTEIAVCETRWKPVGTIEALIRCRSSCEYPFTGFNLMMDIYSPLS